MNILFILRPEIFSIAVMVFLIIYDRYCARLREGNSDFFKFALACLGHCIMALVTEITINTPSIPGWVNNVCHMFFYLVSLLYCLLYLSYAMKQVLPKCKLRTGIMHSGTLLCAIAMLVLLMMPVTYIQYQHTASSGGFPAYFCFGIIFLFVMGSDVVLFVNRHRVNRIISSLMIPISLVALALISIQVFNPEFLFTAPAATLLAVGMFFAVENPVAEALKKAKEAAEKARKSAEDANHAKTAFLFNMSHDIRTPMNAIMGYTELMQKHLGDVEKCNDYIGKIKSSSDFLLSLINNVLEMARIESGKETLDDAPVSTDYLLTEIGNVYAGLMQQKHITFMQTNGIKTKMVYADILKLNEVFLNLVSNAYKYTNAGGTVSVDAVELPCDKPGYTTIEVKVADTGIGMSEQFLPTLFEAFSREHTSTETRVQGTGLGMPIVKKIIDLMGGTITVESELGKGSTFTVTVPHRIAEEQHMTSAPTDDIDYERLAGKRILLAEDNDLNAEIAIEILTDAGFEVERAADGIICVDMLRKHPEHYYDVILMDIQMPNMDGYKATRTIRNFKDGRCNIPIVAMTANAFDEDRRNALNAGMNAHLAKPIDVKALMDTLAEVIPGES